MSSPDIRLAAEKFPYLSHFLDLYREDVPVETAGAFLSGGERAYDDIGSLKSLYESALSFLEKKAVELDFRGDLLELQRGLYRELENIYSIDPADSGHHFFVVVPVADRPSLLRNCVESLIGQCEDFGYGGIATDGDGNRFFRKVTLFIIDDSADEVNRARIKKTAEEAAGRGIRAHYVGISEQSAILRRIGAVGGEASPRLAGDIDTAFHKGASVTRNLACLYLNSFLRRSGENEKVLIYFLDSDEEFGVKVLRDGASGDVRFINYFYWLDRLFSTTDIQVLTGKVVGDPPVSPSVMINTFLDDVLLFLEKASRLRPDEPCPFHHERRPGGFSAEYHDMVELFGYERGAPLSYNCPLTGEHTAADCFGVFSQGVPDFFHGLHPTRVQYYRHAGGFTGTEGARTVYTGNYVFTPAALKYFIPFAGLKLRMAGPTLGRILKARIGDRFVSSNLPLLHRRTSPDKSRVYRSGISGPNDSIDLSGEFIRQFWGDVMLFSVQSLAESGFPGRKPELSKISSVVRSVQRDMWKLYREQKSKAVAKAAELRDRLLHADDWWNDDSRMRDAVQRIGLLCSTTDDNFGEGSQGMKELLAQIDGGTYADEIIRSIHCFHEDESLWQKLLETDIPV